MLAAKARLENVEKARIFLTERGLIDNDFKMAKDGDYFYFPIKKKMKSDLFAIVSYNFETRKSNEDLRSTLSKKLTKKEFAHLKTSFDTIGSIAILEIDKELRKKEKIIADSVLAANKNLRTILRKSGRHSGEFRTQKLKYITGERTKEAVHKENGVVMKLDVEKVYFSPRLSTERQRVANQTKPGENILCMFSGCGPYPLVLIKLQPRIKSIVSVEKNPVAVKYQKENIAMNKLQKIDVFCGDVRKIVPKLKNRFDRILMPLPKNAADFLDVALAAAKKGATVHFYDFLHESSFNDAVEKIKAACEKSKLSFKVLSINKCGQHAPRVFRICVDFKLI
jgi:tRNA (guanine37-N1)-methyltransferase